MGEVMEVLPFKWQRLLKFMTSGVQKQIGNIMKNGNGKFN